MKTSAFLFADFVDYVKNPQYALVEQPDGSWRERLRLMWLLWRSKFVIGFSLAIIMMLVQQLASHYAGLTFDRAPHSKGWGLVVVLVIMAPLMEEGLFRGLLKPRAGQLAMVALLVMVYVVGYNFGKWPVSEWIQVLVAVGLGVGGPLLVYNRLRDSRRMASLHRFWRAHFGLIFYAVAVGFGLVHLSNYQQLTGWHYLLAPVLTLPQLFAGFYLGYVRMKYGIWYGVALHALWNALPASLTVAHLVVNSF